MKRLELCERIRFGKNGNLVRWSPVDYCIIVRIPLTKFVILIGRYREW